MMGVSDAFSKMVVTLANVMLAIWDALSRVWGKLAPLRIRANFLWLRVESLLMPAWRAIEPLWLRLGETGKRLERTLEVSRKGTALLMGALSIMAVAILSVLTPMLSLFSIPWYTRDLLALLLFIMLLVCLMSWGYIMLNDFSRGEHWLRIVGGVLIVISIFSFIPPVNWGLPAMLLATAFLSIMTSSIAGGCMDPDAFDFSIYMGMGKQEPATYHHTIAQQDARYKQSKTALDRVVKKTHGGVDWEDDEMEVVSRELEFESEKEVEFEPKEEVEFGTGEREVEFEPKEEVEFSEEEKAEEFDLEEPTPKPAKKAEIDIKPVDGSEAHTVKDYEADEQKKEMPKEEFKI